MEIKFKLERPRKEKKPEEAKEGSISVIYPSMEPVITVVLRGDEGIVKEVLEAIKEKGYVTY